MLLLALGLFRPAQASVATLRTLASVCSALVLERAWAIGGATSHSARTQAQSAGQSSDQKRSSRASKKLAQSAPDAFSAGRPRGSQLLRRRIFHTGSDVGEEGRGAGWHVTLVATQTFSCAGG